ncbi:POTE ankyrin domain family member B-like [Lepus europaeus]|uniref:POTE ankyrin domain family member B-like n=1 Tax=Lepus europaeus TaxID=9983 RepID=UPI002B48DF23|nr:POTE ankyrin domain family member B-like [Lepus europaeus]
MEIAEHSEEELGLVEGDPGDSAIEDPELEAIKALVREVEEEAEKLKELQNEDGFTPLLIAVHENREKMVEFLIVNKADIYAVDNMNRTTLMLAQQNRSTRIVNLLLEQKIDVSHQDSPGCPAEKKHHQLILDYKEKQSYEMLKKRDPGGESPELNTRRFWNKLDVADVLTALDAQDFSLNTMEGPSTSAGVHNEDGIAGFHSAQKEQRDKGRINSVHGLHKNHPDDMKILGAEDEVLESTLDPEKHTSLSATGESEDFAIIESAQSQKTSQEESNFHYVSASNTSDMVSPIESDFQDVSWDSQKSFSPSPNEKVITVIPCAAREETNENSLTDISGVHKENTSGEEHKAIKSALESEVDISEEELGEKAENEIEQAAKESQDADLTPEKKSLESEAQMRKGKQRIIRLNRQKALLLEAQEKGILIENLLPEEIASLSRSDSQTKQPEATKKESLKSVDKRRLLSPIVKKSCDYHGIKNYTSMEPESEQVISSPVHNAIEATPKEKEKLDGSENNQLQAWLILRPEQAVDLLVTDYVNRSITS